MARDISLTSSRKRVPPVGLTEFPFLAPVGAGEGALFMTEKFRFQKGFRNGGAVDFDERALLPGAVKVDGAGDQFLSRSRFARDEHGGIGGGDLGDGFQETGHDGGCCR